MFGNEPRISDLRKLILPLQGLSHKPGNAVINMKWGPIASAFPGHHFPVGALHEFILHHPHDNAATSGFTAAITGRLMADGGAAIWISSHHNIFPPSLAQFGILPHHIVFIRAQKEKELLWITEEALKCNGIAAVVSELKNLNFMQSRRLQLAVEQSAVTGFILRQQNTSQNTACVSRWQISSVNSYTNNIPGVGHPRWKISLLKMRGGHTGSWIMEWRNKMLHPVYNVSEHTMLVQQKKAV
jgi:protein ImuA